MSGGGDPGFWRTTEPATWPSPPRLMSVSTLSELEACPRRWALGAADYPSLWHGRGYPRPLHLPALEGSVVHQSLEAIVSALVDARCTSLADERAVVTLRALGGFSEVVSGSLGKALQQQEGNPRSAALREIYAQRLVSRIPALRAKVQGLLARIKLGETRGEPIPAGDRQKGPRGQLLSGTHMEATLRARDLGWIGIADLVTISGAGCEIRDYKTGVPAEGHEFQVQVYALLWSKDLQANREGRLANALVISYDDHDVRVKPPSGEELRVLEDELRKRTAQALAALKANPPMARPNSHNCMRCPVRQLCDEYWSWHAKQGPSGKTDHSSVAGFGDIELTVSGRHGPNSWDGFVDPGVDGLAGTRILLRGRELPFDPRPDQRVRVLDAYKAVWNSDEHGEVARNEPTVVTMGAGSEAFVVS